MITFDVHGIPRPAGSKRAFAFVRRNKATGQPITNAKGKPVLGTVVTDDAGEHGQAWRYAVQQAAIEAMMIRMGACDYEPSPPLEGPLHLVVTFRMPRPKGHLRKDGTVKPKAPGWPETKPDVDKLSRAVMDAVKGIVWRDDAQVCVKSATKLYAARPGCSVAVSVLDALEVRPGPNPVPA